VRWLEQAIKLTDKMIEEFWDDQDGGFFFTGRSHEELIVRSKDFLDNATPAGNSAARKTLGTKGVKETKRSSLIGHLTRGGLGKTILAAALTEEQRRGRAKDPPLLLLLGLVSFQF